jgi:hypothetical protein
MSMLSDYRNSSTGRPGSSIRGVRPPRNTELFVERSLIDGRRRQPVLFLHFGIQAVDRERVSIDDLVNSFRI